MGIRGFGSLFGEQQSGDVANVGIDLFFDMLFDSLSKVSSFIRTQLLMISCHFILIHRAFFCDLNKFLHCHLAFSNHGIDYLKLW
jgi:hypothetical protein